MRESFLPLATAAALSLVANPSDLRAQTEEPLCVDITGVDIVDLEGNRQIPNQTTTFWGYGKDGFMDYGGPPIQVPNSEVPRRERPYPGKARFQRTPTRGPVEVAVTSGVPASALTCSKNEAGKKVCTYPARQVRVWDPDASTFEGLPTGETAVHQPVDFVDFLADDFGDQLAKILNHQCDSSRPPNPLRVQVTLGKPLVVDREQSGAPFLGPLSMTLRLTHEGTSSPASECYYWIGDLTPTVISRNALSEKFDSATRYFATCLAAEQTPSAPPETSTPNPPIQELSLNP